MQIISLTLAIGVLTFLAEGEVTWTPLLNLGGVGLVLAWFLWKAEPRMRALEAAVERQSRVILILLLEIQRTTPEGKAQAKAIVDEIDAAEVARAGKKG